MKKNRGTSRDSAWCPSRSTA